MTKEKIATISFIVLFGIFLIVWTAMGKMQSPFTAKGIGLWVGSLLTLSILSFLYDDNPFYKFAEHLFIGVSAAYWMVLGFWTTLLPNCLYRIAPSLFTKFDPNLVGATPQYKYIGSLVLGLMLLCLLIPKISWLSRWALAYIVGATAGTYFTRYLASNFFNQIESTMIPLVVTNDGGILIGQTLSNIFLVAGVFCGLIYFFYSKEHKGWFGKASTFGIWVLMISFGAAFGYTVMGRIALLVGRMQDIFVNWLQLVKL